MTVGFNPSTLFYADMKGVAVSFTQVPVEPVAALGDPSLVPAAHPHFSEYSPQEWDKMRVVAGGRFEGSGVRL